MNNKDSGKEPEDSKIEDSEIKDSAEEPTKEGVIYRNRGYILGALEAFFDAI
jgi:hypothetical protein